MRWTLSLAMMQLLLPARTWRLPSMVSCFRVRRAVVAMMSSTAPDDSPAKTKSVLKSLRKKLAAKTASSQSLGKREDLDALQRRFARVVSVSEGAAGGVPAAVLDASPEFEESRVLKKVVYSSEIHRPEDERVLAEATKEAQMEDVSGLGEEWQGTMDEGRVSVDPRQTQDLPLAPEFSRLGLIDEVSRGVAAQGLSSPTAVQRAVIPRIIGGENLVMAASTGSGKTFAFVLPVIQALIAQESLGYARQPQRPRCLILVPTRELARQVLLAIKSIAHFAKVSSAAVLGGEPYAQQKVSLGRLVDIVVASPGRLMQHKEKGNVFLSHVSHIVIDEVDTMLTQGFGPDIRAILRAGLNKHAEAGAAGVTGSPAQVVMATATLTKAVKQLLNDVDGNFNIEFSDPSNRTPRRPTGRDTAVRMSIVEVDGVHRTLPNVQHLVEDTKVKL